MTRQIYGDTVRQGLTVGACAPSARRKRHRFEALVVGQLGYPDDVGLVTRKDDRLRSHLVNRIVSGKNGPVGVTLSDIPFEPSQPQFGKKIHGQ